ncbi:MAG: hypothetical protein RDU20_09450 [Desulfomonilaceae bacterium]|nr:hypothetical protein [Desulfomonilaceae bacterium]
MKRDPLVEEVRRIRHKIEAGCQNDPNKYYEHLEQVQAQYRERLVRRKPQPAPTQRQLAS